MELAIWCSRAIKYAPIYANITQFSNLSFKYMCFTFRFEI